MRTNRLLVGALWGPMLAGCVLVSDDTANLDLSALQKPYTIDATSWRLEPAAATLLLNEPCQASADPCATRMAATNACRAELCTASCNPDLGRCQLSLRTDLWRTVNLASELPMVLSMDPNDDGLEIMLEDLTYEVFANSFNQDLGEVTVSVARTTVTTSAEATPIGTIVPLGSGELVDPRSLQFLPTGKEELRRRLADYQVPFNLFIGSTMTILPGMALPTGRIETVLTPQGRAGH